MDDAKRMMYFNRAVEAILKNWTALQLLVSHQAAGGQSEELGNWIANATVTWFQV